MDESDLFHIHLSHCYFNSRKMSPVSLLPSLVSCRSTTEPERTAKIGTKITQKKEQQQQQQNIDKLFYDTSYLFPKIVCKRVQRPETKNIVLIISLVARGF